MAHPRRWRRTKLLLAMAGAGALMLISVVLWLLYTNSGLGFVLGFGLARGGVAIEYAQSRGNLAQGFELQAPQVSLPLQQLHAASLQVQLKPWQLLLGREFVLDSMVLDGGSLRLLPSSEPKSDEAFALPPLQLPLAITLRDVQLVNFEVLYGEDGRLPFSLEFSEFTLTEGRLRIADLAVSQGQLALRMDGAVDTAAGWAGDVSSAGEWSRPDVQHRAEVRLSGDAQALRLEVSLEGGGELEIGADLAQPMGDPGIKAQLRARDLRPQSFGIESPVETLDLDLKLVLDAGKVRLEGPIRVDGRDLDVLMDGLRIGDDSIALESLLAGSDEVGQVHLSGHWPLAAGAAEGALILELRQAWLGDWRQTLPETPPRLNAAVQLSGRNDQWQMQGRGDWTLAEHRGAIEWLLGGTAAALQLQSARVSHGALELDLDGTMALATEPQSFAANLAFRGLDPATVLADWPGSLEGSLTIAGDLGEALRWRIDDLLVSGTLRDVPLRLSGALDGMAAQPSDGSLQARWGAAEAALQIDAEQRLQIQLTAVDLASTGFGQGRIDGSVGVDLRDTTPEALIETLSARLLLRDIELAGVRIGAGGVDKSAGWNIKARLDALQFQDQDITSVRLDLAGSAGAHRLQAQITTPQGELKAELAGAYQEQAWDGQIDMLQVGANAGTRWELQDSAGLRLGTDGIELQRLCLRAAAARLCAGLQSNAEHAVELLAEAVPLAELVPLLNLEGITLVGQLDGGGRLLLAEDGSLGGDLELAITSGSIRAQAGLDQPLDFNATVRLAAATRSLEAQIQLPGHGNIDVSAQSLGTPEAVATLRVAIADLGFIDGVSAEAQSVRGQIRGELTLPLAQPQSVSGKLEVAPLAFELPALGLKAADSRITLLANGDEILRLDAEFAIAPGNMRLTGEFGLAADGPFRLQVQGSGSGLVDLPAVRLVGDSNFVLERDGEGYKVQGGVLLRDGRIDLDRFAPTVPASEDVVIVDAPPAPPPLPISADISIAFIQQVDLRGYGLEGKLGGGISIVERPGQPARANGEIVVSGVYSAYGQKLDIERGRLGFANSRADNPSINLLAVRRVDRQRVGVQVRGNAKNPLIQLYSDPILEQSEILSYLVLGRPLMTASGSDSAQLGEYAGALESAGGSLIAGSIGRRFGLAAGVESLGSSIGSALVIGRYLSPRFFLGYGSSLLDSTQIFILRYGLTENIDLEVLSGREQKISASWRTER